MYCWGLLFASGAAFIFAKQRTIEENNGAVRQRDRNVILLQRQILNRQDVGCTFDVLDPGQISSVIHYYFIRVLLVEDHLVYPFEVVDLLYIIIVSFLVYQFAFFIAHVRACHRSFL